MIYLESANIIMVAAAYALAAQRLYGKRLHGDTHGPVVLTLLSKVLIPILAFADAHLLIMPSWIAMLPFLRFHPALFTVFFIVDVVTTDRCIHALI